MTNPYAPNATRGILLHIVFRLRCAIPLALCFVLAPCLHAQAPAQAAPANDSLLAALQADDEQAGGNTASASTNDAGPVGIIPLQPGFNASLVTASQHDSSNGWSNSLTPNVAYRFNRFFSANAGVPVFPYILITKLTGYQHPATKQDPIYTATPRHFLLGDTTIAGQFEAHSSFLDYNVTTTLGTPTGDFADGLGAGQCTYNFNNHFEHAFFDWLTPDIELGIGDSVNLNNTRARKSYTQVGTIANFQAGVSISLPHDLSFSSDAYEDLPLGTQSVTSTTTNGKKGKQLRIMTTTSQKSIGEDNGFVNSLDIPLNGHVTLSGFYNRSLRDHEDTAGFSFTFLLKAPPHEQPK